MLDEDVRWKQRFQNFEKAYHLLEKAMDIRDPSIFEKAGLIQFFEISLELFWNVMKEYLESQGISELRYPRETIKKAFETGLIENGHEWIRALENRNLTSHTCDEERAQNVVDSIKDSYYLLLRLLYNKLKPLT